MQAILFSCVYKKKKIIEKFFLLHIDYMSTALLIIMILYDPYRWQNI
jgi:hypothetical protein